MPEDGEMYLLVPAHPGCPGQSPESRKMVVCVCYCTELWATCQMYPVRHIKTRVLFVKTGWCSPRGADCPASRSEPAAGVERRQVSKTWVYRHLSQSPLRGLFTAGKLWSEFRHQGTVPHTFCQSSQVINCAAYLLFVWLLWQCVMWLHVFILDGCNLPCGWHIMP